MITIHMVLRSSLMSPYPSLRMGVTNAGGMCSSATSFTSVPVVSRAVRTPRAPEDTQFLGRRGLSLSDLADFVGVVVVVVGERALHVCEVEIVLSSDLLGVNTAIEDALGDVVNANLAAIDTWSAAECVVS